MYDQPAEPSRRRLDPAGARLMAQPLAEDYGVGFTIAMTLITVWNRPRPLDQPQGAATMLNFDQMFVLLWKI